MFRKSGVSRILILDGESETPVIRIPEMAAAAIEAPAGSSAAGTAAVHAGHDEAAMLPLYDSDGSTAIAVAIVAGGVAVVPPEAMIPGGIKLVLAGAVTKDETIYLHHKS